MKIFENERDFHRCYTFIYCSKFSKMSDFHRWNSWYVIWIILFTRGYLISEGNNDFILLKLKTSFIEITREYFISEGYDDLILWKLKTSFIEITRDCFVSEGYNELVEKWNIPSYYKKFQTTFLFYDDTDKCWKSSKMSDFHRCYTFIYCSKSPEFTRFSSMKFLIRYLNCFICKRLLHFRRV